MRSSAASGAIILDAKGHGLIGHNPAEGVKIKKPDRDKKKVEIPSKDEIKSMVPMTAELWSPSLPWRPLILTAMFTGLRCSELRGLTWRNVDLEQGVIEVTERADYRNVIGSPKSKAGTRTVPMLPIVVNTLRAWKLACPRSQRGVVFATSRGTMFTNSNIHQRCWKPLKTAAGLTKPYTFHALRHVAASLFIEQGWTPKKVQEVMGNQSIRMTYDTYGHLWDDKKGDREAVAQIQARLLG